MQLINGKNLYDVSKRLKLYRDEINLNSLDFYIKFYSSYTMINNSK
jgi:hypothetical protein